MLEPTLAPIVASILMIYDCFTFNNELELLELRLHELAGVVDKFVLVEATRTHANQPKQLYYQENRNFFSAFESKIHHVIVDDLPDSNDAWELENFQRNSISRGLAQCRADDWVLISDVDEIPRAETVARVARERPFPRGALVNRVVRPFLRMFGAWSFWRGSVQRNHPFILKFQQSLHRHFINCVVINPPSLVHWHGTRMLYYQDFTSAQLIRHSGRKVIEDGGWHFTSMGGARRIVEKIKSFAHQEFNKPEYLDTNRIADRINRGQSLFDPMEELRFTRLDGSYPRYVLEHPERFEGWIKRI